MKNSNVTGWTMTEGDLQTNLGHLEPDELQLAIWCYRWCNNHEHPIPLAEFARNLGTAENTVYKVYSGKYCDPGTTTLRRPPAKLLAQMREFKELEEKRYRLGAVKFCLTETAKDVFFACDVARESRTPVIMSGASHIGKTMALKEYQIRKKDNLTYYVRMRSASGVVGMVKLIAKAFKVSTKLTKDRMVDEIVAKLTPNSLIILDECHLLTNTYRKESFYNCFETIRDIFDAIECGMVLTFTNIGREKVEQEKRGELEQLFRRGVHRPALGEQPRLNDLKLIVRSWGMEYPKRSDEVEVETDTDSIIRRPFDLLKDLSKSEGLKSITERLRYARKMAMGGGKEPSWSDFIKAHLIIQNNSTSPANWS